MLNSPQRASPLPSCSSVLTLFPWILQRDIWELIEACGEKGNILGRKQERRVLRNGIGMCECNSRSDSYLFRDQLANTVFLKSAMAYFLAQGSLQRKYPQRKWERSCLRNLIVMWEFISQSYTHLSWNSHGTLSLRNVRRATWVRIQAYDDIPSMKNVREALWETSLW